MEKMSNLLNRPYYAYSKIDKEDLEVMQHRRAQFFIYKSLQKADSNKSQRQQPTRLKMKLRRLKIKIGGD
uniref:Uncharacterized protein LOC104246057 n=1 Tax=Nicotiana sylvestris TaxID=4096 RepID=A0A1U7YDR8_NICSY|nr:PREDICTED: uncharacterized protein LOC104246057 [Nicotiana sylvestris]